MDISKLPKLSETKPPPAGDQSSQMPPAPSAQPMDYRSPARFADRRTSGFGPEAWISIGVGLIFLFAFPNFTQWAAYKLFHMKMPSFLPITDTSTGAEIPYSQSVFFLNDLCIALFSYALIVEGVALLLARHPIVVLFALVVTAAAVILNLYYLVTHFSEGFSIVSAIAVVFGGYMIWYQSRLMRDMIELRREERELRALAHNNAPGAGMSPGAQGR